MRHAAFRTVSGQRMQNSKTDPCALSLARLALDTHDSRGNYVAAASAQDGSCISPAKVKGVRP